MSPSLSPLLQLLLDLLVVSRSSGRHDLYFQLLAYLVDSSPRLIQHGIIETHDLERHLRLRGDIEAHVPVNHSEVHIVLLARI